MNRRTPILALSLVLSMSLVACGASGSEPAESADPGAEGPTEPVDLTMTVWTNDEVVLELFQDIAADFRAQDPRMGELTVQSLPFEEYVGQVTTQLQGGDPPDLGWVVESSLPAFVESGALLEIGEDLRSDEAYNFDDVLPNTLSGVSQDDSIYGFPFANGAQPVVVNTTLFEQAGVDNPVDIYERGEWTWDELARVSRELVESGEATYGFDIPQFGFSNYTLFTPFMKATGADAWPGGSECGYDSPESQAAVEFLRTMMFEDGSYPLPGETSSFPTGDTGMYLGAPSTLNQLTEAEFEFELLPQPEGVNGDDPFFGQAAVVVFADGENTEVATELLKFITNEESSAELFRFYTSPRQSLLSPEAVVEANPLMSEAGAERAIVEPLQTAEQVDFPVRLPELQSAIRPVMDGLWQPEADVAAVLAEACSVADPILAR
jgi:multiple sugar transport system substrate-binding protein